MTLRILAAILVVTALLTGCDKGETQTATPTAPAQAPSTAKTAAPQTESLMGQVAEVLQTDSYTYARIEANGVSHWCATNKMALEVGQTVLVPPSMELKDYHSKSLDRTFDRIIFADRLAIAGADVATANVSGLPQGHPPVNGMPANHPNPTASEAVVSGIAKLDGGYQVADIYQKTAELAGKTVRLRGQVVKVNANILGTNWIHLRDGSGEAGSNDLTITSSDLPAKDAVVVVEGVVAVDRDFGSGYRYPVLLENAKITAE